MVAYSRAMQTRVFIEGQVKSKSSRRSPKGAKITAYGGLGFVGGTVVSPSALGVSDEHHPQQRRWKDLLWWLSSHHRWLIQFFRGLY